MVRSVRSGLFALVNGLLILVHSSVLMGAENGVKSAYHGVILQYHHVADDTPSATSVSLKSFAEHMALLHQEGFQVWPLPKLVKALMAGGSMPDKVVVITFDDAYSDILLNAAPILSQYEFPFTVFVSTDYVDRNQKGYMNWDQMRTLVKQGATLANHSQSHLHLLRRPESASKEEWMVSLREELDGAEQRIKKETGQNWRYFAYPYGEADGELIGAIKDWGYLGFGQQSGAVDKRLLQSGMAPRFPFNRMYENLDDFRVKASSLPLPIMQEYSEAAVFYQETVPTLELELTVVSGPLNCFASGQGAIKVIKKSEKTFLIRANKSIPVGRSRYNCTMSVAGERNRFYWYSRMWIRKLGAEWYPEP